VTVADVVVVHWPEDQDEVDRLAGERVPRLLLVAPSADPPESGDVLQDWVRLPGDERDVRSRLDGLRRRAAHAGTRPAVDRHGRLAFRRSWVQLSPIEARLARLLIEAHEGVVGEDALLGQGWPDGHPTSNALRVHLHRLRRRVTPLGLEVRGVRSEGWVLQPSTTVEPLRPVPASG
jgi:two-component system OmpR family response regulator